MLSAFSGDALTTTVHPARSAGASLLTARLIGAFHGTMAATTPTGIRVIRTFTPVIPRRSSTQG